MKKLLCLLTSLTICFSFLASCEDENAYPEYHDYSFTAMDTVISVRLARNSQTEDENGDTIYFEDQYLDAIGADCANIVSSIENKFSRTKETSVTWEINSDVQNLLSVDEEVISLIEKSYEIYSATGGAFDITIGTVTELWNVTADEPVVPTAEAVTEAVSHVGSDRITIEGTDIKKLDTKTKLDFGAIAKGYALGKVIEHLKSTNVKYGIVSIGGNVGVFGEKAELDENEVPVKYKVGITDPSDTTAVSGYLHIDKGFISVSGDYERYFEVDKNRYHHIFDSKTGYPAESDIASVAVWSDYSTEADAISTSLFVMGSEKALDFCKSGTYDFEAVFILKDGSIITTDGIKTGASFEEYVPETTEEGAAN